MDARARRRIAAGSALVAVVGAIVTVVYVFQPWRSCDYEDTAMGCAMLPGDAAVMQVAMTVTGVAVVVSLSTLVFARRRSAADSSALR